MPVKVRIPTPLRAITKGAAEVPAKGDDVSALIEDLERQFPGLRERLVEDGGEVRRFINIYVNEEDIRFLKGNKTALKDGDEVSIVPAIAGGSGVRGPGSGVRDAAPCDPRASDPEPRKKMRAPSP